MKQLPGHTYDNAIYSCNNTYIDDWSGRFSQKNLITFKQTSFLDRLYDNHNHIGKYSSEEVSKLRELHVKHGNNWQAIAAHLGRSAASVKDRCRLLNEHCNRGTWSPDEEDRLAAAVYDLAQVLPGEQVRGLSDINYLSLCKTKPAILI